MTIKIVGINQSNCTLRPLLVLAEKGVTDFELKPINLTIGEQKVC